MTRRRRKHPESFRGSWGRMQRPPAKSTAERKRRQWAKKCLRRANKVAAAEMARLAIIKSNWATWPVEDL